MSTLLPALLKPRVTQTFAQLSASSLEAYDALILLIPEELKPAEWHRLPDAPKLQKLLERAKKHGAGKKIRTHLNNRSTTSIVVSQLSMSEDWPQSFEQLTNAREIVTDALQEKPGTLAIAVVGFTDQETAELQKALLLAALAVDFAMPRFRSKTDSKTHLSKITVFGKRDSKGIERCVIEGKSLNLVRWLTALPPNVLDAGNYRKAITELAKENHWKTKFYNEAALKKLGAGAFLAVSQGNARADAGIMHIEYRPAKHCGGPDLALVGKGIVFDTGGTNLKPFKGMLDMHEDMAGSAVALGTLLALSQLKVPFAIDCWLAITENRISAEAYKSRDIVTASNGTTIEVIHTDAEGRMALADTLALAGKRKPKLIMDFATLTGTCVSALTERYSGAFSNREDLHEKIHSAGRSSGERVWTFPMDKDFDEELKSRNADVLQCAPAGGGDHIQAARFLQRFVPKESAWIHIDLSSASRAGGLAQVPSGPTGFGVRFNLDLLLNQKILAGLKQ
jgi:leucyl aminopeptidase